MFCRTCGLQRYAHTKCTFVIHESILVLVQVVEEPLDLAVGHPVVELLERLLELVECHLAAVVLINPLRNGAREAQYCTDHITCSGTHKRCCECRA